MNKIKEKWQKLFQVKRNNGPTQNHSYRTDFHKDYDRIIFSQAFRKLGYKTQVHNPKTNNNIRTRLTHSLEVASVGRSLGIMVGEKLEKYLQSSDISNMASVVQTACLAHDLGNPPFGHAGEYIIRSWFKKKFINNNDLLENQKKDFLYFDGNAQSFRIVNSIEHKNERFKGLDLTFTTLATLMKYPWTSKFASDDKPKFCCYQTELSLLEEICKNEFISKKKDELYIRNPLSYLMEVADDICYSVLDLEDAFEIEAVSFNDIKNLFGASKVKIKDRLKQKLLLIEKRSKFIQNACEIACDFFIRNHENILFGKFKGTILDECSKLSFIKDAKTFAKNNIYNHSSKVKSEIGAENIINILLDLCCNMIDEFFKVDKNATELSFVAKHCHTLMGINQITKKDNKYTAYLKVIDFITGMTDNEITKLSAQIKGF